MRKYRKAELEELANLKGNIVLGAEKEEIAIIDNHKCNYAIYIHSLGKTLPDSNYKVIRNNAFVTTLEYVVSGYGYIERNGEVIKVSPGDVYLLPRGEDHYYYSDKNEPYLKLWVTYASPSLERLIRRKKISEITKIYAPELKEDFDAIFALAKGINEKSDSAMNTLYIEIAKILLELLSKSENDDYRLSLPERIKKALDASVFTNIDLLDIAKDLEITPQYAIKVFKDRYGMPPHQYIINIKIDEAKRLLNNPKNTIEDISYILRFSSAKHFSSTFKKKTGLSPKEYRNSLKVN